MTDHAKPTQAELDAGIAAAAKAAELPTDPPADPPKPVDPPKDPPAPVVAPVDPLTPPADPPKETVPPVTPPAPAPADPPKDPADPDYKKKFVDSTREAQILASKNRKITTAVDQAAELPEPTDDEMKTQYSEWDEMTPTEQRLAKDSTLNKKRFDLIHGASQEGKDIEAWNTKVDEFVDDPKTLIATPALEGKIEDFKVFATKPTRRGLAFDDLVASFLFNVGQAKPPLKKGAMFETGSGGPNDAPKPKDDMISVEESRRLQQTDYNKWKALLKAGKIRNE